MKHYTPIILGIAATVAAALPTYARDNTPDLETFKKCVRLSDDAARLACFDKAAAGFDFDEAQSSLEQAEALKAEVERRKAEQAAQAEAERKRLAALEEKKKEEFGNPAAKVETADEGEFEILKVKKTKLSTFIMLTNHHVWEITEDKRIGVLKPGRKVKIKKAMLGNYRMTLVESGKTANVKRVF